MMSFLRFPTSCGVFSLIIEFTWHLLKLFVWAHFGRDSGKPCVLVIQWPDDLQRRPLRRGKQVLWRERKWSDSSRSRMLHICARLQNTVRPMTGNPVSLVRVSQGNYDNREDQPHTPVRNHSVENRRTETEILTERVIRQSGLDDPRTISCSF